MRSPASRRAPIRSCRAASRAASPCKAPTAQTRRTRRSRAKVPLLAVACPLIAGDPRAFYSSPVLSSGRQHLLDALHRRDLVDTLDGGKFAHQPVERRLVDLSLAIGLLRLAGIAEQVAH